MQEYANNETSLHPHLPSLPLGIPKGDACYQRDARRGRVRGGVSISRLGLLLSLLGEEAVEGLFCQNISQNKCTKYSVGGAGKFPVGRRGARYARATFAVVFPKSLHNLLTVSGDRN